MASLHLGEVENPVAVISIGKLQLFHPSCSQSAWSCLYFAIFLSWASCTLVSHGTVSRIMMTAFLDGDHSTTSGLCCVLVMTVGKINFLARSTSSFLPSSSNFQ